MFNQFEPTVRVVIKFLQLLKVNVNDVTVNESLQNHPDWPSFLICVTDTLSKLNVPNAAGTINPYNIDELPTPFLTYVDDNATPLAIILQVSEAELSIYKGGRKEIIVENKTDFIRKWNGVYLIAEPTPDSGEVNYRQNREKVALKKLVPTVALALIGALFLLLASRRIVIPGTSSVTSLLGIYSEYLIMLTGVVITTLLVWYEIDRNNPILKKVCSGLIKSDCSAVLTSKQSKVLPWLSWSEIGLFYFTGSTLILLFGGNNVSEVAPVLAWISILALPYTVFSIYYQAKIAKQWCVLCLAIQALLIAGSANVLIHGLLINSPSPTSTIIFNVILLYLIPFFTWFAIKPYIMRLQTGKDVYRQYLRLKFNGLVFDHLLKKQKTISHSIEHIGIELGNPNAKNTIVKVCSLNCKPCSQVHPKIESLLGSNKDLKVKIIYMSTNKDSDPATKPTRHLLAIAKQDDPAKLKSALNDWHLASNKDYDLFAAQYPINEELLKQSDHMAAMSTWCNAMRIGHTPTFFINGYELPEPYNIDDVQHLLLDS